jgi:hypothetical protein
VSVEQRRGKGKTARGERVLYRHLAVTTGVARLPASSGRAERLSVLGVVSGRWERW